MKESGPEAKQRLIEEAALLGMYGMRLCERHYFLHIEGSFECMKRTVEELSLLFADKEELLLLGY